MINNNSINAFSSNNSNYIRRSMATSNRKVIDAKNARRLKIQQKKKKNSNTNNNKVRLFLFIIMSIISIIVIIHMYRAIRNYHSTAVARASVF